jgi:hydrogenase expression/formation protein HypE
MGKLSTEDLKKLLSCIRKDPKVIVPPLPGFDSGVHLIDGKYLVVSTDPCAGVPEDWFGWLLVNYAASDVALFGARPEFCSINLLGSSSTTTDTFLRVMRQTCKAADELGISIVTGHTGTYQSLSALVGVCTAYGTVRKEKLMTPAGARPGDYIICTKPIGLEVVVNLALTNRLLTEELFGAKRVRELAKLVNMQSCVREALILAKISGVHALHDATEGGLITALNEIADASKVGLKIDRKKIRVAEEMNALQKAFRLSDMEVLSASSTGTILAAVSPKAKGKTMKALQHTGLSTSVLGTFTKTMERILVREERETPFPTQAQDPYALILSGKL